LVPANVRLPISAELQPARVLASPGIKGAFSQQIYCTIV
jgi:hypothetical protein